MSDLLSKISDAVQKEVAGGDLKKKVEDLTGTSVENLGAQVLQKAKDVVEEKTRDKDGVWKMVNDLVKQ